MRKNMFTSNIIIVCCLLLSCNAFIGRSSEMLKILLSGSFLNHKDLEQAKLSGINMPVLTVSLRPVIVPDLSIEVSLLLEQFADNQLIRQEIQVFTDDGDYVNVVPYLLYNSEKFIPGTYNISDIESLTQYDVYADPSCTFYYERLDDRVLMAYIPDCAEQEQSSTGYLLTTTCEGFVTAANHENHTEISNKIAYHFDKVENFPIPQIPSYDILKDLCNY